MHNGNKSKYYSCQVIVLMTMPFLLPAQSISGVINSYYKVLAINTTTNEAKLNSTTGLHYSDKVLVIQMKGATVNTTNSSSFGNISTTGSAGAYEFAHICAIHNDTVLFKENLINSYDASSYLQLVKVETFTNVTISDTLKAQTWDASTGTGGVIAIEASGTVTLNSGVSATGSGFAGGTLYNFGSTCAGILPATAYYYDLVPDNYGSGAYKGEGIAATISGMQCGKGKFANGGGGGNNHNTGGAGGANYGSGGNGGNQTGLSCNGTNAGIGGAALNTYGYSGGTNRIFMGGGGGAGHENNNQGVGGGNGGGIIFITCATLDGGSHTIEANGKQPVNTTNSPSIYEANGDGGGGGGAGGVVIIDAATISTSVIAQAKGAAGNNSGFLSQCTGPGGGGGGGVVWISAASAPGTLSTDVTGGSNGVVKVAACLNNPQGATAGANGTVLNNYIAPKGVVNCTALAVPVILNFTAVSYTAGNKLNWTLRTTEDVKQIAVEHSYNKNLFTRIAALSSLATNYNDVGEYNKVYYRLLVVTNEGKRYYSNLVMVNDHNDKITIAPNPVKDNLTINITATNQLVMFNITDVNGRVCRMQRNYISSNSTAKTISAKSLLPGMYYLHVITDNSNQTIKFIKQ